MLFRSNGHALFVGTFRPTLVYHLARKKKEQSMQLKLQKI